MQPRRQRAQFRPMRYAQAHQTIQHQYRRNQVLQSWQAPQLQTQHFRSVQSLQRCNHLQIQKQIHQLTQQPNHQLVCAPISLLQTERLQKQF